MALTEEEMIERETGDRTRRGEEEEDILVWYSSRSMSIRMSFISLQFRKACQSGSEHSKER
jgi:hypothetical protein